MKTNNHKHRYKLLDILNKEKYVSGEELKKLIKLYYSDDEFIGDHPEFLSIVNVILFNKGKFNINKKYTIKEEVIMHGNFFGCKKYVLKEYTK